jgi:hypothetical protein
MKEDLSPGKLLHSNAKTMTEACDWANAYCAANPDRNH